MIFFPVGENAKEITKNFADGFGSLSYHFGMQDHVLIICSKKKNYARLFVFSGRSR